MKNLIKNLNEGKYNKKIRKAVLTRWGLLPLILATKIGASDFDTTLPVRDYVANFANETTISADYSIPFDNKDSKTDYETFGNKEAVLTENKYIKNENKNERRFN